MHSHDRESQRLAIGLAMLAGFVDALGFLSLGGFFISFMSGNSTRFSVGLVESGFLSASLLPLGIIVLFVIGVMIGKIIRRWRPLHPSSSVLCFMSVALFSAALMHTAGMHGLTIACMIIAMGAANNVFVREGEVAIGVTYMTGTLVKLGQRLAGALLKEPGSIWFPYLLLWLGLVAGALLGAASFLYGGLSSLWGASLFCFLLALFSRRRDVSKFVI